MKGNGWEKSGRKEKSQRSTCKKIDYDKMLVNVR
jgi:hypothetical protein